MPSTDSVNRSCIVRNSVDLVDEDSRTEIVDSESEILKSEQPQDFDLNEDSNYCLSFKPIIYYSKYMTKYICHAASCTCKQLSH